MPTALICYNGGENIRELMNSLTSLDDWDLFPHNLQMTNVNDLAFEYRHIDLHYIIYTIQLNPESIKDLQIIIGNHPQTYTIYYNSSLINQQFRRLADIGVNSCIVGVERKKYLKEYLSKIWLKHWKRIPGKLFAETADTNTARAKKIIKYLENRPVAECTPNKISAYLNISSSHFRTEFKSKFGINFREFKQRLFNHYESELLLSKKYKPNDICKILKYKHIANYSRSFRKRHGECWRNLQSSI
jgi:AraC-like DNA-binding protein